MRLNTYVVLLFSTLLLQGRADAAQFKITPPHHEAAPPIAGLDDVVPAAPSLAYLIGYKADLGRSTNAKCVKYEDNLPDEVTLTKPADLTELSERFDFDQGSSLETFFSRQNLSVGASLGIGSFKADAAFRLATTSNLSRFSEYLRITVNVEKDRQLLDISKIRFTDYGEKAISDNRLFELCGDGFVIGKLSGGEFSLALTAGSNSAEQQSKTSALMTLAYKALMNRASMDASASNEMQSLKQQDQLQINLLSRGGGYSENQIRTLAIPDLIQEALQFKASVAKAPWVTGYILASYDAVPGFAPLNPAGGIGLELENKAIDMRRAYRRLSGLTHMIDSKTSGEFGTFDRAAAITERDELQKAINTFREKIGECVLQRSSPCNAALDAKFLSDVPERATRIDIRPKFDGYIQVVQTVGSEEAVVENRGSYNDMGGAAGHVVPPASPRNTWQFINRNSGVAHTVAYDRPIKVPPNMIASFRIDDSPHDDNEVVPGDLPHILVFTPLQPKLFSYPNGYNSKEW